MAYLDISSKTALILLNTDGTDDPDQLVGVAAGELFEPPRKRNVGTPEKCSKRF